MRARIVGGPFNGMTLDHLGEEVEDIEIDRTVYTRTRGLDRFLPGGESAFANNAHVEVFNTARTISMAQLADARQPQGLVDATHDWLNSRVEEHRRAGRIIEGTSVIFEEHPEDRVIIYSRHWLVDPSRP